MGCGGGGATYAAFLIARAAIRAGRTIRVVSADYLLSGDLAQPDAWIAPCGFMGSPSVSSERIPSGEEIPTACISLRRFLGLKDSDIAALISCVLHSLILYKMKGTEQRIGTKLEVRMGLNRCFWQQEMDLTCQLSTVR